VVDYQAFKEDLEQWSTLAASTYMHKPYEILIDDPTIKPYQEKNLISAICLSALFNLKNDIERIEVSESEFFRRIIRIPYIKGKSSENI